MCEHGALLQQCCHKYSLPLHGRLCCDCARSGACTCAWSLLEPPTGTAGLLGSAVLCGQRASSQQVVVLRGAHMAALLSRGA